MANFIEEVDEEVRRERLEKLWKRWSPAAAGFVIVLLAGVAGFQFWQSHRAEKAAADGAAFNTALNLAQAEKPAEAAAAFASLAGSAGEGYALLARFQQAANLVAAKDIPGAIAAYDAIVADAEVDERFRNLARYLAAFHGLETLDAEAVKQRLAAIPATGPWSANARELQAMAELKAGNVDAARQLLTALADDALAPAGLRGRATELLAALGGPVQ